MAYYIMSETRTEGSEMTYDVGRHDYEEKVYAGVLGKLIGVYLGRPFEQWSHERIERELGEIQYYVHEKLGQPLVVTDDDITGTFTFLRALSENDHDPKLTPAQMGDWWLNTIIEGKTILWWGGFGLSTEQTAFLRLKAGVKAPQSGSIAVNGRAVAEEIGAQIFIDGWGLIFPDDPARAAEWARRAASVSHDGEAIYGAQVIAALVSLAFVETDLRHMLETAAGFIPETSLIFQLIRDMTAWAQENGDDWRATLARVHETYPYSRFGTNCPMVSNHAVILLALLHGRGSFSRSLTIANTAGYDTDCNAGNVGCILGVLHGLDGLSDGPDWRGPVADRLFLPTADGGRAITDALREAYAIVGCARVLHGQPHVPPKSGARFHFSLPGSVQGWQGEGLTVANEGSRLALTLSDAGSGRASTSTFIPPDATAMSGYALLASPTLYSGQTITAVVSAPSGTVSACLYVKVYGAGQDTHLLRGPIQHLSAGLATEIAYALPDTDGQPVCEVGLEMSGGSGGKVLLDRLTWDGTPDLTLKRPTNGGEMWKRAWVSSADEFNTDWVSPGWTYRVIQNEGVGLVTQGESAWKDYTVSAAVWPHLSKRVGLIAAGRGLRRYVALLLDQDKRIKIVRRHDDMQIVLAESSIAWEWEQTLSLSLTVTDGKITATVDGKTLVAESDGLPAHGAIGFLVEQGHAEWGAVTVHPA